MEKELMSLSSIRNMLDRVNNDLEPRLWGVVASDSENPVLYTL